MSSNVKEMQSREKVLNTYGFDVMDIDQSGNLIYRQKKVCCDSGYFMKQVEVDHLEGSNDNKLRVQMAEKLKVVIFALAIAICNL